jgi:hypothetical protein
MESYVRPERCSTVATGGTIILIVSTWLMLSLHGVALAQSSDGNQPAASPPNPPQEPNQVASQADASDPVLVQPRVPTRPQQTVQIRINELNRRRSELTQKARQYQLQWMNQGQSNNPPRDQIAAELRSIHEQMCGIEKELVTLDEQRRQGIESQLAREQERARELIRGGDKLRAEAAEVQQEIERLDVQNRREAVEIAAVLDQTRREIRVMEQRLTSYGIDYSPRTEPPAVTPPVPPSPMRRREEPPMPRPNVPPPVPSNRPVPGPSPAELNGMIQNLREEVRQLRAELRAIAEREQAPPGTRVMPQPEPPMIGAELQQLHMRLDALEQQLHMGLDAVQHDVRMRLDTVERQLQRESARTAPPEPPGRHRSPYSVGSADQGWYPNIGW